MLTVGDPAPWFEARTPERPDFSVSQAAGRYVVLSFFGSAGDAGTLAMLDAIKAQDRIFNDGFAAFFAISSDPDDEKLARISQRLPGFHIFWDPKGDIATLYQLTKDEGSRRAMRRMTYVLDPNFRVLAGIPIADPKSHAQDVIGFLGKLPPHERTSGTGAPVLVLPRVFEPEFCRLLIDAYDKGNSGESGFMITDPETGRTVLKQDHNFKKRRDASIADDRLRQQIDARIARRLVPEVKKVFQFDATRIERYIVARYDAEEGGFFRPHRDNTTKGTSHRRFAVTINLNAEEYEGGDLRFAEFDRRTYRAPTGGAVVFSCSLLHEATPVTKGTRYAFLPFLYDDAAAAIRQENMKFVQLPQG